MAKMRVSSKVVNNDGALNLTLKEAKHKHHNRLYQRFLIGSILINFLTIGYILTTIR